MPKKTTNSPLSTKEKLEDNVVNKVEKVENLETVEDNNSTKKQPTKTVKRRTSKKETTETIKEQLETTTNQNNDVLDTKQSTNTENKIVENLSTEKTEQIKTLKEEDKITQTKTLKKKIENIENNNTNTENQVDDENVAILKNSEFKELKHKNIKRSDSLKEQKVFIAKTIEVADTQQVDEKEGDIKVINLDSPEDNDDDKGPLLVSETKKKIKKPKKNKKDDTEIIRFNPSLKEGLNDEQVESRLKDGLVNVCTKSNEKTYLQIILSNVFTFFNTLCFIIAAILLTIYIKKGILKENITNMLFLIIIICNMTIGIIQEIKAKMMVNKIKLMVSPSATVIRNADEHEMPITDLVLDDIILLSPGKQIPADCIVVEGEIEANESLLTGESVPVKKKKNAELYSGSFVVSGKAKARVEKIGDNCYNAKLAQKAKTYKKPNSELLKSMNAIIKFVGIIILPIALLTLIDLVSNNDVVSALPLFSKDWANAIWDELPNIMGRLAASVIAMIPAGMFLLTSMALAVGVIKLAKKRTLVHDLYSIEMLARTDVLCLDKTGTITDGSMEVKSIIQLDLSYVSSMADIIGSMLTALNDNNQTTLALANHFGYNKEYSAKAIIPFSSARKFSAVTFRNGETYMYGAPEYVLKTRNPDIEKQVKIQTKKGFRVLLFARCNGEIENDKIGLEREPICLIIIEDHIRADAQKTIQWFKSNNVQVKVISGDSPMTVSEVSKKVGVDRADLYISLEGLSEQQVIDAADSYTVFGRVTPEQKCTLVKALKAKGHKVAMTGDGVNDILALKEADCSIAMASGSEAARNVSNLVLLDNNFNSMPSVVAEGRRVVNNVQNSASIFLVKTMFTILISLFYLILPNESFPFQPRNFLMMELFMSGLPTFFLALQPNDDIIKGNFFANLIFKVIPGGLTMVFNIIMCYVTNILLKDVVGLTMTPDYFMTMCCLVLTFTGMIILYKTCKPINFYRGMLLTVDFILLFVTMFVLPKMFIFNLGFTPFNLSNINELVYFLATLAILLISTYIYSNLLKIFEHIKEKIIN